MKYESVTQEVSFSNVAFAALMSGMKYDVIPQNGDCSRESYVRWFFETKQRRYRIQYG
jgi:hypothetical protein